MRDYSIVVPTFDRPASLERLLSALTRLNYPVERFEVIVIDDGSASDLEALVSAHCNRLNLTLLRQANAGPAAARNRGARQATGRHLVFTDDDCQPDPDWLKGFESAVKDAPGALCGGRTTGDPAASLPEQAAQLLMDYLHDHYNPIERSGAFYPTNNMAVPLAGFLHLGGFDETLRFGEDRDFCYRWQCRGLPFVYAAGAVVFHAHPLSFPAMLQLHFRYGAGTYHFRRVCRRKGLARVGISSPDWYLGLAMHGVRRVPGWHGVALSLLLVATQAASAAGMLGAWLTKGKHEVPELRHRDLG